MTGADPFALQRFVTAQERVYDAALSELRAGRKRTHWIWFVFPQLAGLGSSPTAARYAISGLDEARAYLRHDVLGPRLRECCEALLAVTDRSADQIFGWPDVLKVRSSMTLFGIAAQVAGDDRGVFASVLDKYYAGLPDGPADPRTLANLGLTDPGGTR
ncbi:DUF1810 domain-containing protein [Mycobacterium sp. Y57]|uniref:DUF1810 domain-containing protein n=1 Tax=Mycolicibacterium xanthum TaxID=2796469 RepID=UPI001C854B51|nr:DUF1810 domain-containing protein [Mycolicibacterium xanthum]MBX7434608.1 DUF1810 domain-containing protein [Mycolicibacterium xanthum]